jgi:hypothetical protein
LISLGSTNFRIVVFHTDDNISVVKVAKRLDGFIGLLQKTKHLNALIASHSYTPITSPKATSANTSKLTSFYNKEQRYISADASS